MMRITDLPQEILIQVFLHLDGFDDRMGFANACSRFRSILTQDWVFKQIGKREFPWVETKRIDNPYRLGPYFDSYLVYALNLKSLGGTAQARGIVPLVNQIPPGFTLEIAAGGQIEYHGSERDNGLVYIWRGDHCLMIDCNNKKFQVYRQGGVSIADQDGGGWTCIIYKFPHEKRERVFAYQGPIAGFSLTPNGKMDFTSRDQVGRLTAVGRSSSGSLKQVQVDYVLDHNPEYVDPQFSDKFIAVIDQDDGVICLFDTDQNDMVVPPRDICQIETGDYSLTATHLHFVDTLGGYYALELSALIQTAADKELPWKPVTLLPNGYHWHPAGNMTSTQRFNVAYCDHAVLLINIVANRPEFFALPNSHEVCTWLVGTRGEMVCLENSFLDGLVQRYLEKNTNRRMSL